MKISQTTYLHGDLELKIINARPMVDNTNILNYLERINPQKSVDIAIRLHKKTAACSKISYNLDHSTGQYKFQVSLAHSVESNVSILTLFLIHAIMHVFITTI